MIYPTSIIPNPRPLFYFKDRNTETYFGIKECSDTNVHRQIVNVINFMYPNTAIRILDIACGEGALSLRLQNVRDAIHLSDEIIMVDILPANKIIPDNMFYYQIDLNNQEHVQSLINKYENYFDVILGIETIEHLDNPKLYIENLSKMVKKDGHIFISSPDINNPMCRRIFYKTGRIEQFSEQDLEYGHVSVILPHIFRKMISDLQLSLVAEYPLGLYPKFWLYPSPRALYITFCNMLKLRLKGSWVKLYILKRGE